jgi:hypothetical protein
MRKSLFIVMCLFTTWLQAQTSYTWRGITSTDWNTASNWNPAGVPTAIDNATIVTGSNNCILANDVAVTNLTITSGTLNLNAHTLTTTGVVAANGGVCNNGTFNSTATSLTFAGTAFGADIVASVTNVYFNGSTFNGTVTVARNNTSNISSTGKNIFNSTTIISNEGSGQLNLTNNAGAGREDVFNAPTTFITKGAGYIYVGYTNNVQLNDNIIVDNQSSTGAIYFGRVAAANTITLGVGKTISCTTFGGTAFLYLRNLKQLDNTPLTLNPGTTGGVSIENSVLDGNVSIDAGKVLLISSTYNGTFTARKTGTIGDASIGGNTFNSVCSIENAGTNYLRLGNTNPDTWNADVTFINSGTSVLSPCYNSAGNQFNGNISVSSTGGTGVYFCNGANGTATLAAGKTISNGIYTKGYLILTRFTQLGSIPVNLNLALTANYVQFGPSSDFGGNVTVNSPGLLLNRTIFNGTFTGRKTGATGDASTGGNTFNSVCSIENAGTNYLRLGNTNPDTWNADVTFINSGTNVLSPCYNSAGNQFNGNISVSSTGGAGIYFCNGANGTATLAAGKTISNGTYDVGYLILTRFTQLGSVTVNLNLASTANYVQFGPSSDFGGNVTVTSPGLYLNGAVFNGTFDGIQDGAASRISTGGNTFKGNTTITNNGIGYLYLANVSDDIYEANVTYNRNGSGALNPAYTVNANYFGDVTVSSNSSKTITFGKPANGTAVFTGGNAQTFNKTGSATNPTIYYLTMNKSNNDLTLNTRINIANTLTLTQGIINTTSINLVNMNNNSTTTIGNNTSYINGPMKYDMAIAGPRTLNFPVGKVADWRPIVLQANHSTATSYTYNAEVFNASAQALGYTIPPTVDTISKVHYWDLDRTVTASGVPASATNVNGQQTITLYYDLNDKAPDPANLTIVKNTSAAPTSWLDIGGTGATPNVGSITSTSSLFNSYSRFTLADKLGGSNPLPVELISFSAQKKDRQVQLDWATASERNNDYFEIERSQDAQHFEYVATVKGVGNSVTKQIYQSFDANPETGVSYYRLKQVDFDGKYKYTNIASVQFNGEAFINFFPNPAANRINYVFSSDYEGATIKITNTSGAIIKDNIQLSNYDGHIDATELANGIYYLIVQSKDKTETVKLVVQK